MKTKKNAIDLKCRPNSDASVLIWQNIIHQNHFDQMIEMYEKGKENDPTFNCTPFINRINNVLQKADDLKEKFDNKDINLIVMSELSVIESHLDCIKDWSKLHKNTLIVAGSCYKKIIKRRISITLLHTLSSKELPMKFINLSLLLMKNG